MGWDGPLGESAQRRQAELEEKLKILEIFSAPKEELWVARNIAEGGHDGHGGHVGHGG